MCIKNIGPWRIFWLYRVLLNTCTQVCFMVERPMVHYLYRRPCLYFDVWKVSVVLHLITFNLFLSGLFVDLFRILCPEGGFDVTYIKAIIWYDMELYTNFQLALANVLDKNSFTFIAVIFFDGENMKYKLGHYICHLHIYSYKKIRTTYIYNATKWIATGKINCFPWN